MARTGNREDMETGTVQGQRGQEGCGDHGERDGVGAVQTMEDKGTVGTGTRDREGLQAPGCWGCNPQGTPTQGPQQGAGLAQGLMTPGSGGSGWLGVLS